MWNGKRERERERERENERENEREFRPYVLHDSEGRTLMTCNVLEE